MLESINASIKSAQILRQETQKLSTVDSLKDSISLDSNAIQLKPFQYTSPYIATGSSGNTVYTIRDTQTGEAVNQFPLGFQIRAYQKAQSISQPTQATAPESAKVVEQQAVQQNAAPVVEAEQSSQQPASTQTLASTPETGNAASDVLV